MELFSAELMSLIWLIFAVYSTFLTKTIKLELGVSFFGVKLKADKFNFPPIKTRPQNYLSLFHDE